MDEKLVKKIEEMNMGNEKREEEEKGKGEKGR